MDKLTFIVDYTPENKTVKITDENGNEFKHKVFDNEVEDLLVILADYLDSVFGTQNFTPEPIDPMEDVHRKLNTISHNM